MDLRVVAAVVITLIACVPVTILGFDWYVEKLESALITTCITLGAAGTAAILLLTFRGFLLRKLRLSAKTSIEDIADPFLNVSGSLANGEYKQAAQLANDGARRVISRVAWVLTYRSILAVVSWAFLSFATVAGTAVLVRQNTVLQEQSEILGQQKKLLREQNILAEASRRSLLLAEVTSVLDAIEQQSSSVSETVEIEDDWIKLRESRLGAFLVYIDGWYGVIDDYYEVPRTSPIRYVLPQKTFERIPQLREKTVLLSRGLYGRIAMLSESLRPLRSYDDDGKVDKLLSRERAYLFRSLASSDVCMYPLEYALDLSYADFRGARMQRVLFSGMRLQNADFNKALLEEVVFDGCDLRGVSFENSTMKSIAFRNCIMPSPDRFAHSDCSRWVLDKCLVPSRDWGGRINLVSITDGERHKITKLDGVSETIPRRSILSHAPRTHRITVGTWYCLEQKPKPVLPD